MDNVSERDRGIWRLAYLAGWGDARMMVVLARMAPATLCPFGRDCRCRDARPAAGLN